VLAVRARSQEEEQEEERARLELELFNDAIISSSTLGDGTDGATASWSGLPRNPRPDPRVMALWRGAHAVCFDIDCTVAKDDSLDALAAFLGKGDEVRQWTNRAMDGGVDLETALEERMRLIDPTPAQVADFLRAHPAGQRLNPGIRRLVRALQQRGVAVYLISGGFRELALPVARELGVAPDCVFANRMLFTADDETGLPTRFAGFDAREPTCRRGGKPEVIESLRALHPYENVVMVGDGITDLEAATEGAADCFVGYGGTVLRPEIAQRADWLVYSFDELFSELARHRVAFVGSGAWACAAAKLAGENSRRSDLFEDQVAMWVYEEEVEGRPLAELINERKENVKYLPGVPLEGVRCTSSLAEAVEGATAIVVCAPHEFVHGIMNQLQGRVASDAIAISLTKGMRIRPEGPQLISELVRRKLGVDCSVLMGANIASEIGAGQLSEGTIGYKVLSNALVFKQLFQTDAFNITMVPDVEGAEMCGTLKNVVALAAGFSDGLGMGSNTKAAIIRQGLAEMRRLSKKMFLCVRDETFLESCGVADLVASCYGGRNRRVAEAFARAGGEKSMEALAGELLGGQKLQGALTANEVHQVLESNGWTDDFPLFTTVWKIVNGLADVQSITSFMAIQH